MSQGAGFAQTTTGGIAQLGPSEDDHALVEGLKRGDAAARRELFERFAPHCERVLARVLGKDPELPDALHDTFVQAFASVSTLRDASALKSWMSMVAVYTARGMIRRRRVRRWLAFWNPGDLPEQESHGPSAEVAWAVKRVYAILDGLPADHRIAFSLRYIEGMSLQEVGEACSCSLATVKRRLGRAQSAFLEASRADPVLAEWMSRFDGDGGRSGDDAEGGSP